MKPKGKNEYKGQKDMLRNHSHSIFINETITSPRDD